MAEEIHLRDEDRLPWLESVETDRPANAGAGRTALLVLLGLLILAAIVFAAFRLGGGPRPGAAGPAGEGALIQPQDGDYKIKPDDPGGLHLHGEGDTAVATSTGAGTGSGHIDSTQMSEKPVTGKHAAPAVAQGGATARVPAPGGRLAAPAPASASTRPSHGAAAGGSVVQLGAFPTESAANAAWSSFAKRFSYLASLGKEVQPADVNGRHVFRLRVNTGSANAAADICGRLHVAREDCFVVPA